MCLHITRDLLTLPKELWFFLKSITLFSIYSTGTEKHWRTKLTKNKSKITLWRIGVLLELGTVWWVSPHSPFVQRGSQEACSRSTDLLSVPSDERCGERYSLPGLQACSAIKTHFEASGGEDGFSSALCTLLCICWILKDAGIVD